VVSTELALAPVAIQDMMKDVKGAEFKFAKTLALPFFHTGVVDLPPGGEKRMKNSRKNHMVFWVFYGRVRVDVAGAEFSVGKGGMWQVPRGELLHFIRGCFGVLSLGFVVPKYSFRFRPVKFTELLFLE